MQQAIDQFNGAAAFSDPRVFIVRPGDRRLARGWPQTGGFEQSEDGPVYIVIGQETTDDRCRELARRFFRERSTMDAGDLTSFRDRSEVESMYTDPSIFSGRMVCVGASLRSKRCIVYVSNGREQRTAWYSSRERAQKALDVIRRRYGNGIIYVD